MAGSVAFARREPDAIVVAVPRALTPLLEDLAAIIPTKTNRAGSVRLPPTYAALELLTRVFRDKVELDERLRRAMIEVHKRQIVRRQIVGPRTRHRDGPFVASPSRQVFHRTSCEWAGEIGAEMLVLPSVEAATRQRYRPCRLCRPLETRKPPMPDELKPTWWDEEDEASKDRQIRDRRAVSASPFLASARSLIYHRKDCEWAAELGPSALSINSAIDAEAMGYRGCRICQPFREQDD